MKPVGLPPPSPSFPVEVFDAVNERVSLRAAASKSAWLSFASAWSVRAAKRSRRVSSRARARSRIASSRGSGT